MERCTARRFIATGNNGFKYDKEALQCEPDRSVLTYEYRCSGKEPAYSYMSLYV